MVRIYTKCKEFINIKELLGDHCTVKCNLSFPYNKVATKVSDDVLSSLSYSSGYVERNVMNNTARKELF